MNWDWSLPDIISLLTVISFYFIAWWNGRSPSRRVAAQNLSDNTGAMKLLNESITLAATRALEAEKQLIRVRDESATREQKLQMQIEILTGRIATLEADIKDKLSYRIMFDVVLGTNPTIEKTDIKHYPDRRKERLPVANDRRSSL